MTKYVGADCEVQYCDEPMDKPFNVFIKFGEFNEETATDEEMRIDEGVFYYCRDLDELEKLYNEDAVEDFVILSYQLVEETE